MRFGFEDWRDLQLFFEAYNDWLTVNARCWQQSEDLRALNDADR